MHYQIIPIILLLIAIVYVYIKLKTLIDNQVEIVTAKVTELVSLDTKQYQQLKSIINSYIGKPTPDTLPIGTISTWPSNNIPSSYLLCDGNKYLISNYSDLFLVIGSTYNKPDTDSSLYFNLPDLRGSFIKGLDSLHTLGQFEKFATALPNNPFKTDSQGIHTHTTDSQGDHSHFTTVGQLFNRSDQVSGDYASTDGRQENGFAKLNTNTTGAHTHNISSAGAHTHNILGGDYETRPNNFSFNFIIKATNLTPS
mgnify:CR=1 FL=1